MFTISQIKDPDELDVLLDKEARFGNLRFSYSLASIEELKKRFHLSGSLYLMAKDTNGEFSAFSSMDPDWREPNHLFLREVFVMPTHQKLGLGRTLLERCIEHAKKHQFIAIVTQTPHENLPMQKLCERLGFCKWENPEWKEEITYKLTFQ